MSDSSLCIGPDNGFQSNGATLYGFLLLMSAEPAGKYFTGHPISVRRYEQVQLRLISYQVPARFNSSYLARG